MSKNNTPRPSKTDWGRVDAIKDEEIDYSDIPELEEDFWKRAVLWQGNKVQLTLRLDPDVLALTICLRRGTNRHGLSDG